MIFSYIHACYKAMSTNVVAIREQAYDPTINQWCSAIVLGRVIRTANGGLVRIRLSDGLEVLRSFHDLVLIHGLKLANRPTFCIQLPNIHHAAQLFGVHDCPGKGFGIRANRTHVTFPIALGITSISLAEANKVAQKGQSGADVDDTNIGTRRSRRRKCEWRGMYRGAKPGLIVESAVSGGSSGQRRRNFCIRSHWVYYCNAPSDGEQATHQFSERRSNGRWELYLVPLQPVLRKNKELIVQYNCDWRMLE